MFQAGKIVSALILISLSLVLPEMNTMLINAAEWSEINQTIFRLSLLFSGFILLFDYLEQSKVN